MKFVYLTTARIPDEWAHVVQILTMCDAFAQGGAEVTLVAPRRGATKAEDPYAFAGVPHSFSIKKLPCLDLFPGTQSRLLYWVRSLSFLGTLAPYLLLSKADIVYTRDPLLVLVARALGKKTFWEIHTAEKNSIAKAGAVQASKVIVISNGLKEYSLELGTKPENVVVENDAVSLSSFEGLPSKESLREELSLSPAAKVIAYVGKYKTMGEAKGVEGLIHAGALLAKQFPEILLLIVGLYPEELPEVKKRMEEAGLSADQYQLVAHVPKSRVPAYLIVADVLVMNYPNTHHYAHIMSPLKMYEYMASGTPIVTSDLPTIREALDERTATFCAPDSTESLAEAIAEVFSDTVEAQKRAEKAREVVTMHTWSARASRILELI